jgi:uncharacterized phage protein (predicted DNA packaging)
MVTLTELKAHLRVEHADEDALIQTYLDAAATAAEDYTGVTFTDPAPDPVRAAVLLLAADLYEHREAAVVGSIRTENRVYQALLNPYRELDLS